MANRRHGVEFEKLKCDFTRRHVTFNMVVNKIIYIFNLITNGTL